MSFLCACACRSFMSFSRRSLSEVSVSSNWEADSLVLLSSASSASNSEICSHARSGIQPMRGSAAACLKRLLCKLLINFFFFNQNEKGGKTPPQISNTVLPESYDKDKETHPALQSICVQSQFTPLFLHSLQLQFLLLYLLLEHRSQQ